VPRLLGCVGNPESCQIRPAANLLGTRTGSPRRGNVVCGGLLSIPPSAIVGHSVGHTISLWQLFR
jgi:hypothetical protein